MTDSGLRVWGIGTSRTIRVHWALEELGLEYETREILPRTESMRSPDFVRLSARGKVPLLEDGERVMGESGAILFHLAERYRDRIELAPESNTRARADFDDLCFFILTELDAVLYIIRRHEGLPELYGSAPVATQAARDYFLRQVGEPESRVVEGRRQLLGENFC